MFKIQILVEVKCFNTNKKIVTILRIKSSLIRMYDNEGREKERIRMRNSPRCDIWLVLDLEGINVSPDYEILSLTFHRNST